MCAGIRRFCTAAIMALIPAIPAHAIDPMAPLVMATPITVTANRPIPNNPDVLGTAALNAGVTLYDARFRRVSAADRGSLMMRQLAAPLVGLDPVEQLIRAKALVESRVHFGTDLDTLGVADFWSEAGETLQRGIGDDEDIAIAEMQLLKAAGFSPYDLYISIGREKTRGSHVVLLARTAHGFYLLDNNLSVVVPAGRGNATFVPMITVGVGRSWIHGYRIRPARLAVR